MTVITVYFAYSTALVYRGVEQVRVLVLQGLIVASRSLFLSREITT
jgi:hypothetical protein